MDQSQQFFLICPPAISLSRTKHKKEREVFCKLSVLLRQAGSSKYFAEQIKFLVFVVFEGWSQPAWNHSHLSSTLDHHLRLKSQGNFRNCENYQTSALRFVSRKAEFEKLSKNLLPKCCLNSSDRSFELRLGPGLSSIFPDSIIP